MHVLWTPEHNIMLSSWLGLTSLDRPFHFQDFDAF
jgi:hypothetical protein